MVRILSTNNFLKNKVAEITAGQSADHDKVKNISRYIKENVAWNGMTDFMGDSPKEVLERKSGSSGDINLLMGALLKNANIPVWMVLISTRDHGLVFKDFPSLRQFDDVLCLTIAGKDTVLLDATEKMLPYNILPKRCLHYDGWVILKNGYDWVNFGASTNAKTSASADFTLSKDGVFNGKLTYAMDGYSALEARQEFQTKGEETYVKDFVKEKNLELKSHEFQNMDKYDSPPKEIYDVSISDQAIVSGDYIYINPYLAMREESNPFKEETREYPIDFVVPIEKIFFGNVVIPDGYTVEELPPDKIYSLPKNKAKYYFSAVLRGNKLTITSRLQQKQTLFMPEDYPALKEFYNLIVSKKSEQIILKKKP